MDMRDGSKESLQWRTLCLIPGGTIKWIVNKLRIEKENRASWWRWTTSCSRTWWRGWSACQARPATSTSRTSGPGSIRNIYPRCSAPEMLNAEHSLELGEKEQLGDKIVYIFVIKRRLVILCISWCKTYFDNVYFYVLCRLSSIRY